MDEYGDMDQVALDFCDWYGIRWWHFYVKNVEICIDLVLSHNFLTRKEARKLFGHEDFLGRG